MYRPPPEAPSNCPLCHNHKLGLHSISSDRGRPRSQVIVAQWYHVLALHGIRGALAHGGRGTIVEPLIQGVKEDLNLQVPGGHHLLCIVGNTLLDCTLSFNSVYMSLGGFENALSYSLGTPVLIQALESCQYHVHSCV